MSNHAKTITAYAALSLDGRIASTSHEFVRWTSREDWDFFQSELSQADVVVVGAHTFLAAKERLEHRNTIVLSRNMHDAYGTVAYCRPEIGAITHALAPYRTVAVIGGSFVYRFFLERALIDVFHITIEPVVLGSGIHFLAADAHCEWYFAHATSKQLNARGTVMITYTRT